MRLALCRICERADRLASSGNPVLFGLFNRLIAQQLPTRLDECCLAIEFENDPTEHRRKFPIEVRLIDEDGHTLTIWRALFECGDGPPGTLMRSFLVVPMPWDDRFEFQSAGSYRLDVVYSPDEGDERILGGEVLVVAVGTRPY